jgi:hypothetical protein
VRASHPRFEGSERVLHSLPAHAHGIWHPIEPGLHRVEDPFVFPMRNLRVSSASVLKLSSLHLLVQHE